MTQEQKDLLLKDLCGRLPYKVKAQIPNEYGGYTSAIESIDNDGYVVDFEGIHIEIEFIKPYLFPLSSMSDEQKVIYGDLCYAIIHSLAWDMQAALNELNDWLNKNHFDHNNLIPKGLANDATNLNVY